MRNTGPDSVSVCEPAPALTVVVPIALAGGQEPCVAAGSGHNGTEASSPSSPGGSWALIWDRYCCPSPRETPSVSAVCAPAASVLSAVLTLGAKGGGDGQAPPLPSASTVTCARRAAGAAPDDRA